MDHASMQLQDARRPRLPLQDGGAFGRTDQTTSALYLSRSPAMNASSLARAMSSAYCSGGDFMKYDAADSSGPPMPRSRAIFAQRSASMMTPAELGESQT